jgi:N-acetylmuramic acid 6-phosphate etherase
MNEQDDFTESSLDGLVTESRSPALAEIDSIPIAERCRIQNRLDEGVACAVGAECDAIARAVSMAADSLRSGGRLIYVGAGTSGRLGVLDAAECPPTFGTDPNMVQGIIAGGARALVQSVEGAEDDETAGAAAMDDKIVSSRDVVVGVSSSGRTPYVLGAMRRAAELGARTVGITNNRPSRLDTIAAETIAVVVGPEFVAGSTRLKAGTAQKLVLNMISTQTMIELGKTYGDAMVDVLVTNAKLRARARRLVMEIAGANSATAEAALDASGGSAKVAIVMIVRDTDRSGAIHLLDRAGGRLRVALQT